MTTPRATTRATTRSTAARARTREIFASTTRVARARGRATTVVRAATITIEEAGKVLSHVVHATTVEPDYRVLKLGLSLSNVTDPGAVTDVVAAKTGKEAKSVAWVVERASASEGKRDVDAFWANVNAEAIRQLFPSVTPGNETAALLRSLYFKAERAALSECVGGLATCALLRKLTQTRALVARDGRVVRDVRAMKAPRPLKGGLFANPEILYHGEKGPKSRRNLLTHEFDESIAAKLGTRAAFHQTAIVRIDDAPDANDDAQVWLEIDIAGPALDNYEFSDDGAVPLCVASVSAAERAGWTTTVDELLASSSADDIAAADAFADRAYSILVSV